MAGYQPADRNGEFTIGVMDAMKQEFFRVVQSHLRFQDKTRINWIPLASMKASASQFYAIGDGEKQNLVELVDYSDYLEFNSNDSAELVAMKAGIGAVSTYNALLGTAMRKYGYGCYATELLQPSDNLNVNIRANNEPSVMDPEGLIYGWIAWRFKFGAGRVK